MCSPKEMANVTGNDQTSSASPEEEPASMSQPELDTPEPAEGSAWDIGAPLDERGAGLAEELGDRPDQDTP